MNGAGILLPGHLVVSKLIDITFGSQVVVSLLIDKRGRFSSTEPGMGLPPPSRQRRR